MQINLRGNRVAVEKLKKADKSQNSGFIILPKGDEYVGEIKYVGDQASPDLKVGQFVYFTTSHQSVRINGVELCVMEDKEVFATVTSEK